MLRTHKNVQLCVTTRYMASCKWWEYVPTWPTITHSLITTHHVASCSKKMCISMFRTLLFCNTPLKKKKSPRVINFLPPVIVLLPAHLYQILWFISHCFQGKNATILPITSMGSFGCWHFLIIIVSTSRIWWLMKHWGVWVLFNSFGGFCFDEMIWLSNLLTAIWRKDGSRILASRGQSIKKKKTPNRHLYSIKKL